MKTIIKDSVTRYGILVLLLGITFAMWRRQESLTQQTKEQTKQTLELTRQIQTIMESPKTTEIVNPEIITEYEKTTDNETVRYIITDRGGSFRMTDYATLPYEVDTSKRRWGIWGVYDGGYMAGVSVDIWKGLNVGIGGGTDRIGMKLEYRF